MQVMIITGHDKNYAQFLTGVSAGTAERGGSAPRVSKQRRVRHHVPSNTCKGRTTQEKIQERRRSPWSRLLPKRKTDIRKG